MKISVVVPVLNEKDSIGGLYRALSRVRDEKYPDMEFIFIDDGSTDETNSVLTEISQMHAHNRVITFGRNYGQTAAILAGMQSCSGDVIITIDGDFQNDPQDIPLFIECIEKGYDVVCGRRVNRQDPWLRVLLSNIANKLISAIVPLGIHDIGCTFRAYKKEMVKDLLIYGEMHRFIPLYCKMLGAQIAEIPVRHRMREHGQSKYGFERIVKVVMDLMIFKFQLSFFPKPMYVFGSIGMMFLLGGAGLNIFVLVRKVFLHGQWLSPLFFLGIFLMAIAVIAFLMGFLADIIVRFYFEVFPGKLFKVKNIENSGKESKVKSL
ncbi:MAG: glycosyltransferase family 2 protein [Elusimicrobia bacterium]|nr:glycosyltransferase family 2 protein [Elusimicrobiota bacterium]